MVSIRPAIYVGSLRHRRFSPKRHDFTYPIFMVCLDIDRIPEMMSISSVTSYNRWNWASFFEEDHFGNVNAPLRQRLIDDARKHKTRLPDGKIFLLTHLRYLGYNFNPVSFFYCYDSTGKLQTIVGEVNNTFGETRNYWLSASEPDTDAAFHCRFAKEFHVSPFLDLDQQYDWTFASASESLIVQTNSSQNGSRIFDATLSLEPREWNRRNLHAVLRSYPWMTLKVIGAIHWQAICLWWKNVPVVRHPGAGKFARANVQHFAASWKPGEGKASSCAADKLHEAKSQ